MPNWLKTRTFWRHTTRRRKVQAWRISTFEKDEAVLPYTHVLYLIIHKYYIYLFYTFIFIYAAVEYLLDFNMAPISEGQTPAPGPEDSPAYHFITFVEVGRIYTWEIIKRNHQTLFKPTGYVVNWPQRFFVSVSCFRFRFWFCISWFFAKFCFARFSPPPPPIFNRRGCVQDNILEVVQGLWTSCNVKSLKIYSFFIFTFSILHSFNFLLL